MQGSRAASEPKKPTVAVVIVAAGRGERAGQPGDGPKQYRNIGGRPVIARAIDAFLAHPSIGPIAVAIHPDDGELFRAAVGQAHDKVIVVTGGATRQDSVRLGLVALRDADPAMVLIHDAARPFVDSDADRAGDCCDRRAPGGPARFARRRNAEARRCRRPGDRDDRTRRRIRRADAAGLSVLAASWLLIRRRIVPAGPGSPTTPRLPNGPKCRCGSSPARPTM